MRIYLSTDNYVKLEGLTRHSTGAYVNDATVTARLLDIDGAEEITGSAISLTYIASSNGDYAGVLPDTVTLTEGVYYIVECTIVSGTLNAKIRQKRKAVYSTGT